MADRGLEAVDTKRASDHSTSWYTSSSLEEVHSRNSQQQRREAAIVPDHRWRRCRLSTTDPTHVPGLELWHHPR